MGVPISFLDKYNPDQFEILDAPMITGDQKIGTKVKNMSVSLKWKMYTKEF
jgi:hypothetical protein